MSCFQKHTIFVVTLVLLLPDLFGQVDTNAFRKYNIYDGLANNTVTSIIQDKKGFMWFGTQNGLSKYDGYEFSNYYHDDNDSLSLSDNDINTLFLDSDNNLWVGTMNGLCKYNSKKDNFTIFKYKERISSISNDVITSICEDTSSSLWIGTINGLNKINHKTSEITCFYHNEQKQNSISSSKINTLYLDSKNNLWIGTRDAGLNKLIKKKNGYQFETHNLKATFTEGWSEKNIYSICEDKKGNFWIGTYGGGIFYYDPENKNIIK